MQRLRHDPITQSLHWIIALAIVTAYTIGLVREDLPKGDFRSWLLGLHMSIGMTVLGLSVVRIAWRAAVPAPPPLTTSPLVGFAAKAAHLGLYAAMIAVPVLGLAAAWAKGRGLFFFGLFAIPSPIAVDKPFAETLEEVHAFAAHAMLLLAGLHAVAAIAHQFVLKDGTLGRMLPFARVDQGTPAE